MKVCLGCCEELVIGVNWTEPMRSRYVHRCTACHNFRHRKYNRAWRQDHREEAIEALRRWRKNNPEKYQQQLERSKEIRRSKKGA